MNDNENSLRPQYVVAKQLLLLVFSVDLRHQQKGEAEEYNRYAIRHGRLRRGGHVLRDYTAKARSGIPQTTEKKAAPLSRKKREKWLQNGDSSKIGATNS
jgi:hypothetical protein